MRRPLYWAAVIVVAPFYLGIVVTWAAADVVADRLDRAGAWLDRRHDRLEAWTQRKKQRA
mgnify:CR=1 FL=1